jgi:hypothetical protein
MIVSRVCLQPAEVQSTSCFSPAARAHPDKQRPEVAGKLETKDNSHAFLTPFAKRSDTNDLRGLGYV